MDVFLALRLPAPVREVGAQYIQVPTPQWNGVPPNGVPGGIKLSCWEFSARGCNLKRNSSCDETSSHL